MPATHNQSAHSARSRGSRGGAFKVSRRYSNMSAMTRSSIGDCSPEPHCMDRGGRRDEWLGAWEQRLKMREVSLELKGIDVSTQKTCPILEAHCAHCHHHLSSQCMTVGYKDTATEMYSTNQKPNGIKEDREYLNHGQCQCRLVNIYCRCGVVVGYHMLQRCPDCVQETSEDEDHEWFFEGVDVRPAKDPTSGDYLFWAGQHQSSLESSSLENTNGELFDENESPVRRQDGQSPGWDVCSPLMDRNGRQRASDVIKRNEKADIAQKAEELANREQSQFAIEIQQITQQKYLSDATAQQQTVEKELAMREEALKHCKVVLDAREMEIRKREEQLRQQGGNEATKCALERSEQKAAVKEAEAEALKRQLTEQKNLARSHEERLAGKNQEIQLLQTTIAEVKREMRRTADGFRGMLPFLDEANATPHELRTRVKELQHALSMEKIEVTTAHADLQQARQECERKDAELERLLPEYLAARGAKRTQAAPEVERLRRELDQTKRELEHTRMQLVTLRPEAEPRHMEAPRSVPACRNEMAHRETEDFAQARLQMATKLSEKRRELDRREQAIRAREASQGLLEPGQAFAPIHAEGVQHVAHSHGNAGGIPRVPQQHSDIFSRISCPRRQQAGYPGRTAQ